MVSRTAVVASSSSAADWVGTPEAGRMKIVSEVLTGESARVARIDSVPVTAEKPEFPSRDHWSFDSLRVPMERLHGCVALMLRDRPSFEDCLRAWIVLAAAAVLPTFTLMRGGTVTDTMWVRLTDPACAADEREVIALPRMIAAKMERR